MKKFFQKMKNINISPSLFVLIVMIAVSFFGIKISKLYAADSYLGGASNNLVVQGGAILGATTVTTGLVVQTGNVGIGTASPNAKLNLYATSGELVLRMQNAATGGRNWEFNSKPTSGAFSIIDRTASADRLLINANGNVGIGTTNPYQKLNVEGAAYITGNLGIGTASPSQKLDVYGSANVYGDLQVQNNTWGDCHYVAKTFSCTDSWALLCDEGEFLRGISNNGGSNTCFNAIYCCEL